MPASPSSIPSDISASVTHKRIQQVFRDLVKEGQTSLDYAVFLARVRPVTLRSTGVQGSTFRQDVKTSVMYLLQLKHISLNIGVNPPIVHLTPLGKKFYKSSAQPPSSRARRTAKIPRPSRKAQAIAEYQKWAAPLIIIQNTLATRALNPDEKCPVKCISATLRSDLESADGLRGDNSNLSVRLHDLCWEVDQMEA